MTIEFNLSEASIDDAIRQVNEYTKEVQDKTRQLVSSAAERLEEYATYELSKHIWTGETIASLQRVTTPSGYTARVLCGGAAIWLEFGTGVVANPAAAGGYAHPKAAELGMYPIGEYGLGHGSDPNGWWYYDEEGRKRHTYGIPATMFMYHSGWNVRRDMPELAKGVFRT